MRCKAIAVLPVLSIIHLFIFCSNPADSKRVTADQVYGTWQTSQTNVLQEKTVWTFTFDPAGTFTAHIVTTHDTTVLEDITNGGTWSLSNNTLTQVWVDETCVYKILAINDTSMTLQETYSSSPEVYTRVKP